MKKLLLVAGAALAMSACADSTTAPARRMTASDKSSHDFTCRSGYVIAYDENGNPYCVPDGTMGTSTSTTRPKP